ncbi:MAG: hypothetical protein IK016_00145 [Lachnospiraceae bacterium]|nr:hypothetical protein [Lachnospiraceae bacterium]
MRMLKIGGIGLLGGFSDSYEKPFMLIPTGGADWYGLLTEYSQQKAQVVRFGTSFEWQSLRTVSEGSQVRVLMSDGGYAVWDEWNLVGGECSFWAYNAEKNETETFATLQGKDILSQKVRLYGDRAFYMERDEGTDVVSYYEHHLNTGERSVLDQGGFAEKAYSVYQSGHYLFYSVKEKGGAYVMRRIDLDKGARTDITLPENVRMVYDFCCDESGEQYALYYQDAANGSENIGIFRAGDKIATSLFTFAPPCHAYLDRLEIRDNLLMWVIKTEASGRIADHHTLVAYDYINQIPYQFGRAFSYAFKENALFLLAFSAESMNIELYHVELSE